MRAKKINKVKKTKKFKLNDYLNPDEESTANIEDIFLGNDEDIPSEVIDAFKESIDE